MIFPGPSTEISTNASNMLGKAVITSLSRISPRSSQPPKYPVRAPKVIPAPPPMARAHSATKSVVPPPLSTRLKMSRPKRSVPKRWRSDGARFFSAPFMAAGS